MKLEDVLATIRESLVANKAADLFPKIEKDLIAAQQEEKENREPAAKKGKSQFQIVLSDPEGLMPKGVQFVGWALKMEDGAPLTAAIQRIKDAAIAHNNSKRGRKVPVNSIGETIQFVKRNHWKRDDGGKTLPQNAEPVYIQVTDNKL